MSLANDNENTNEVQDIAALMSYGELTMIKLEEFFGCAEKPYAERKSLPVPAEFWDWRKENKNRPTVLNKAGLVLDRSENQYGRAVWTADLSAVTADTLDEARDERIKWNRTEKELKERARLYLRQCDRMKYHPGAGKP